MSLEQMLVKPGKKMGETSLIPQHEKQILFSAQIFEGCHVGEIPMGNWFTKAPSRGNVRGWWQSENWVQRRNIAIRGVWTVCRGNWI